MAKRSDIELRPPHELTPEERAAVRAQEFFVVQAQVAIHRLMRDQAVSQAELARRLGVSEARVSSMFSNDKNFTLRTIGKIIHALGEEPMLTTTREFEMQRTAAEADSSAWAVVNNFDDCDPLEERRPKTAKLGLWAANDLIYEKRQASPVLNS